jgi:3-oxoadipate enol-lactonase
MPDSELVTGLNLHYLDENSAAQPNVLLLHGLGANCDSWQLQTPHLVGAGYRVIIPDVPGFGKSTFSGGRVSIASLTQHIIQLLDCLKITSTEVLVNTFARLNIAGPRQWPYYLQRLILLYTVGIPAQARAVARRLFPRPEQELLRQELITQILQADPRGYRSTLIALARFNVADRLKEIHLPTLVISGDADTTVPMENQHQLVKGISGARHLIIPNAGHAVIVEEPEIFNRILLDFLR